MLTSHKVPFIYPDEHILSVAARWYSLSGWKLAAPSGLITPHAFLVTKSKKNVWGRHFASIIQDYYPPEAHLDYIHEHSTFGYEFPFLNEASKSSYLEDCDEIIRSLGATQNTANLAWRWCEQCIQEDYKNYGWSYWHTSHQLPLVSRCLKHDSALLRGCDECGQIELLKFQPCPKMTDCDHCKPVSFQIDLTEESHLMHEKGLFFNTERFQQRIREVAGLDCDNLKSKHNFHLEKTCNKKLFDWADSHGVFDSIFKLTLNQRDDRSIPRSLNLYRVACGHTGTNTTSALLISKYLGIDLAPLFDH